MKVLVQSRGRIGRDVTASLVRRAAHAMLHALDLSEIELSILLCDDARMRALNRQYRGMDRPTDVLAFALRESAECDPSSRVLGDIVISIPTARRQAATHDHSLAAEVRTLLAHGLLHLLGWDHRTDAEDRRMTAEVARLVGAASRLARANPR